MKKLEQYFNDEESWKRYSSHFSLYWTNSDFETKLLGYLENRLDFAQVIHYHLGQNSIGWIYSKVPDLDELTPIECLQDEVLIKRLKVLLMRFP
ncbi:hypothetical protein [Mangrovimonas xylaniphaga]|uniref:hypothetical protein n=1 Tax=Mangrovimonas xylaniphaga TaxID=1645915 RepID=UPI0006B5D42E|nr:hypothetical protein [Mangrovimonas xylaniphaga]